MNNINMDMYNGEVEFESDDYEVTRALVFYLKAKAVAEIVASIGWLIVIGGGGFVGYKVSMAFVRMFTK